MSTHSSIIFKSIFNLSGALRNLQVETDKAHKEAVAAHKNLPDVTKHVDEAHALGQLLQVSNEGLNTQNAEIVEKLEEEKLELADTQSELHQVQVLLTKANQGKDRYITHGDNHKKARLRVTQVVRTARAGFIGLSLPAHQQ